VIVIVADKATMEALMEKKEDKQVIESTPPRPLLDLLATLPSLGEDFPTIEDTPSEAFDL